MTETSHLSSVNKKSVASYHLLFQKLVYISGKVARRRRTTFLESCMRSSDGYGSCRVSAGLRVAKLHLFLSILTPSGAKLHLANCTLRVSKVDTSDETL